MSLIFKYNKKIKQKFATKLGIMFLITNFFVNLHRQLHKD